MNDFRYLDCDIPPGMTLEEFRSRRARGRRGRSWWNPIGWLRSRLGSNR
jgi:hypothetical protein